MAQEQHNEALIDRYLKGELEGDELREVEARIAAEEGFRESVEQRKDALAAIAVAGRELLRERFRSIHREMEGEVPREGEGEEEGTHEERKGDKPEGEPINYQRRIWVWWGLAAGILLLLIPALLYFNTPAQTSTELFAAYFQPNEDRNFEGVRGDGNDSYTRGTVQFREGDYQDALPIFQDLTRQYPDSLIFQLFSGTCLLGTDQAVEARKVLQPVADQKSAYQAAAQWYIGLSYLQEEDPVSARPHFEYHQSNKTIYSEDAGEVLQELE